MRTYADSGLYLIPLFPLIGALLWGLFGKKLGRTVVSWLAPGMVFLAASEATLAVLRLYRLGLKAEDPTFIGGWVGARLEQVLYTWIGVADLNLDLVLRVDPLTAVMLMVVCWVSFLIHVYSVGYMAHDEGYWRYFSQLNLFVFAMLVLVMGGNLPVLFIGWEGVGLCSYLLIGFWYQDQDKAQAGLKAFVVNRIGDLGFLVGMFALFGLFGTLDFGGLESAVQAVADVDRTIAGGLFAGYTVRGVLTFACIALFIGACGKSAQIPLHVWLPDAMAGPTPVSALIHASTMVTAGVYLCLRLNFLFSLAPTAMLVVAVVGGVTALFAATIALAQNDIKKVLAYSTVSQLGYMFLAVGVGAYGAAIFHLMTHAFFKACLFLGAGSVIHACSGEQDLRQMGGLHEKLPITFWTMALSTLAIMGFPLFSGFFSKDEILWLAFASPRGHWLLWLLGLLAAGLTAFYMWRLMLMTFSGETRGLDEHTRTRLSESPLSMAGPLLALAALAAVGGFVGMPAYLPGLSEWLGVPFVNYFAHWLDPQWVTAAAHPGASDLFAAAGGAADLALTAHGHAIEGGLMGSAVAVGLGGALLAFALYLRQPAALTYRVPKLPVVGGLYRTLLNKYWVDEVYGVCPVGAVRVLARFCARVLDDIVVDGLVTRVPPFMLRVTGSAVAWLQNGDVQRYLSFIACGLAILLYALLRGGGP
ncbi:MAG: NADH-quinone oxidoreductase subunit L [Deltaproteobacteria bacterium]|nr:NADH-quinone oxidoreductase subunit L [Deltaproteobacteria bacterium]